MCSTCIDWKKIQVASKWLINVRCGENARSSSEHFRCTRCIVCKMRGKNREYANRIEMRYSEMLFSGCWVCPSDRAVVGNAYVACILFFCLCSVGIAKETRSIFFVSFIFYFATVIAPMPQIVWMCLTLPSSTNRNLNFSSVFHWVSQSRNRLSPTTFRRTEKDGAAPCSLRTHYPIFDLFNFILLTNFLI